MSPFPIRDHRLKVIRNRYFRLPSVHIIAVMNYWWFLIFALLLEEEKKKKRTLLDEASDDDDDTDDDNVEEEEEEEEETMERVAKRARRKVPNEIVAVKRKLDFDDLSTLS